LLTWLCGAPQPNAGTSPSNFVVGVAPPTINPNSGIGEDGCGIGLDIYGYIYLSGRYFHITQLANWQCCAKALKGSSTKHRPKFAPVLSFREGKCEVTVSLDLKEGTLRFVCDGRTIATIADVKGPLHAGFSFTSARQKVTLQPGPVGRNECSSEELLNVLKAKGTIISKKVEGALLTIPRDVFVPRDRLREAFRDQKVGVRVSDGSTIILVQPSLVATAFEKLQMTEGMSILDVGCGSGYSTAVAACLTGPTGKVHGIECSAPRCACAPGMAWHPCCHSLRAWSVPTSCRYQQCAIGCHP
jgi:hypothetical protein